MSKSSYFTLSDQNKGKELKSDLRLFNITWIQVVQRHLKNAFVNRYHETTTNCAISATLWFYTYAKSLQPDKRVAVAQYCDTVFFLFISVHWFWNNLPCTLRSLWLRKYWGCLAKLTQSISVFPNRGQSTEITWKDQSRRQWHFLAGSVWLFTNSVSQSKTLVFT